MERVEPRLAEGVARRSATPWGWPMFVRGLKSTATIIWSLRDQKDGKPSRPLFPGTVPPPPKRRRHPSPFGLSMARALVCRRSPTLSLFHPTPYQRDTQPSFRQHLSDHQFFSRLLVVVFFSLFHPWSLKPPVGHVFHPFHGFRGDSRFSRFTSWFRFGCSTS